MVNATGAEAIRNRARRGTVSEQRARARALGYDVTEGDFLPAKNKKFPYYSRARNRDCFIRDPRLLDPRKPVTKYHRRNDVQEAIDRRGVKRTLVIERPLLPDERRQVNRARRAKRRAGSSSGQSVTSSANSSPSSTLSSKSSAASSATSERWFALNGARTVAKSQNFILFVLYCKIF